MFDTNNKYHAINIKILAAEDTWETPSLILATAPSGGKVIFSQVTFIISLIHNIVNNIKIIICYLQIEWIS